MNHNEIYLSLEISEHSIKAVVGEFFKDSVNVLVSYERVYDVESDKINEVLKDVRSNIVSSLGYEIKNTILVIPSYSTKKYVDKIKVDAINNDQLITKDEIALGIDGLVKKNDNQDDFVVNVVVDKYSAYGYGYVSNPVGLETRYIELEASIYTVPTALAYPLIKLVEDADFNVVDVCLDIIALSKEVVNTSMLKSGAIIVDMNSQSTNIAYFRNNTLKSYAVIEIGGRTLSKDIAKCAQLSVEKAESFKMKYVDLNVDSIQDLVVYKFYNEVKDEDVEISQKLISEIAKSRMLELLDLISKELNSLELSDEEIVYFTSGGNNILGLEYLLKNNFKYVYNIVHPKVIGARNSKFTKCLGAIRFVAGFSRIKGEIKLFVNKKEYIDSINLVEKNNLLYNSNNSEKDFIKRLVSYIFNN